MLWKKEYIFSVQNVLYREWARNKWYLKVFCHAFGNLITCLSFHLIRAISFCLRFTCTQKQGYITYFSKHKKITYRETAVGNLSSIYGGKQYSVPNMCREVTYLHTKNLIEIAHWKMWLRWLKLVPLKATVTTGALKLHFHVLCMSFNIIS